MELRQTPHYVADRCLLDSLAYASEYASNVQQIHNRWYEEQVVEVLERLHNGIVFLVRPHKGLSSSDGERLVVSYEQQLRIDAKIELLLQLEGIRPVRINELGAAQREEQISLFLEAKGFVKK